MAKPRVLVEDFADMLHFDEAEEKQDTAPAMVQGGMAEMEFRQMEPFPSFLPMSRSKKVRWAFQRRT